VQPFCSQITNMYINDPTIVAVKNEKKQQISYYHAALLYYGDNVLRKPIHQHDAFITVHVELINEAKPVDHQTGAKP